MVRRDQQIGLAVFLYWASQVQEFGWATNVVVFFAMLISFCAVPLLPFAAVWSFRRRNEPLVPSHVVLVTVTKLGYASNGALRSTNVQFRSPGAGPVTAKVVTVAGNLKKGQRVAVLYYSDDKVELL